MFGVMKQLMNFFFVFAIDHGASIIEMNISAACCIIGKTNAKFEYFWRTTVIYDKMWPTSKNLNFYKI